MVFLTRPEKRFDKWGGRLLSYFLLPSRHKQYIPAELDRLRDNLSVALPVTSHHFQVRSVDGATLDGVLFEASRSSCPLVVFFPPNGHLYEEMKGLLNLYLLENENPFHVLFFNYRGVGKSRGSATSIQDLVLDGRTVVEYALHRLKETGSLVFHGYSLGGGIGSLLIQTYPGAKLLLDRTFGDLKEVVAHFGGRCLLNKVTPWGWELQTEENIKKIPERDILVLTADQDRILPSSLRLVPPQGASHIVLIGGHQMDYRDFPDEFKERIKKFINE